MGNAASRNDEEKSRKVSVTVVRQSSVVEEQCEQAPLSTCDKKKPKPSVRSTTATTTKSKSAEESAANAAAAQPLRQASVWSFGSLSGRLNWSFTSGATKNSFRHRNKSTRKSLSSQQVEQQKRHSKTTWHRPLTNAIFRTHFKESSRNDQFHIEQLVAKGAFGVVFKVIDKRAQQQQVDKAEDSKPPVVYALKVLKKSKIIKENSVQQLKEEADIQKLCGHHPFLVQQIDLWQNRRNLHILSEYVPNGELFSKIKQFSINLIRLYLAEIALAIDFLHNAGIIYRDAKPENILLTESYHVKLTDFGLSKWLKLGATTKTICGTFQYMAPEVLRGLPYGHAVDWWSLGIIACEMFTQKSPDIKSYLNVALPSKPNVVLAQAAMDQIDNVQVETNRILDTERFDTINNLMNMEDALESQAFLPTDVALLPREAQDVLKRLLTVDPKKRIHSVLALQRIALYLNFKIDMQHLLEIRPLDIIKKDKIIILKYCHDDQYNSSDAEKAFQRF